MEGVVHPMRQVGAAVVGGTAAARLRLRVGPPPMAAVLTAAAAALGLRPELELNQ